MNATDLIIGMSLMLSGAAYHDDGYVEVGAAVHSIRLDAPEIDLGQSIFEVEAGLEYDRTKIFFRHNSGFTKTEQGGGFNLIGFKYRVK
jgi:hypothetical protein